MCQHRLRTLAIALLLLGVVIPACADEKGQSQSIQEEIWVLPLPLPMFAYLVRPIGDGPFRERLKGYGIEPGATEDVLWNFEKFLVDRSGRAVARFAPDVTADDPRLLQAIEAETAKPV